MLPVARRLREPAQFRAVTRQGERAVRRTLVAHLRPGAADPAGTPQVGFVVAKSVGGAVVRNRVRRRLQHAAAASWDRLDAGDEVVVRALPAAAGASYAELRDDLVSAVDRAHRTAGVGTSRTTVS